MTSISRTLEINAAFLSLSAVATSVLGFIFWWVASANWTAEEIGVVVVISSMVGLVSLVSVLGSGYSVIRYSKLPSREYGSLVSGSMMFAGTIGGLLGIAGLAYISYVGYLGDDSSWAYPVAVAVLLACIASGPSSILDSVMIGLRKSQYNLAKSVTQGVTRVVILPIFFGLAAILSMVTAFTAGIVASLCLGVLICRFRLSKLVRFSVQGSLGVFRTHLNYSIMSQVSSIFLLAPVYLFPMIVAAMKGSESAAFFYFPWMVASILFSVSNSISSSTFAEVVAEKTRATNIRAKSIHLVLIFMTCGLAASALLGEWFLGLIGHEYAENSYGVLLFLVLGTIPWSLSRPYISVLRSYDYLREVVYASAMIAVLGIGVSVVLLTIADVFTVGIAWGLANSVGVVYLRRKVLSIDEGDSVPASVSD